MLTAAEVRKIRQDRAKTNHETYKGIVETAYSRIKARANQNATCVTFVVPAFVPGRPVFAHGHAIRYVTEKLQRGGFRVEPGAIGPRGVGALVIDWSRDWAADAKAAKAAEAAEARAGAAEARAEARRAGKSRSTRGGGGGGVTSPVVGDTRKSGGGDLTRKLELLKRSLGG